MKRNTIVTIGEHQYQIGWNREGWFACDLTCSDAVASDYFPTLQGLMTAVAAGAANFG